MIIKSLAVTMLLAAVITMFSVPFRIGQERTDKFWTAEDAVISIVVVILMSLIVGRLFGKW